MNANIPLSSQSCESLYGKVQLNMFEQVQLLVKTLPSIYGDGAQGRGLPVW